MLFVMLTAVNMAHIAQADEQSKRPFGMIKHLGIAVATGREHGECPDILSVYIEYAVFRIQPG